MLFNGQDLLSVELYAKIIDKNKGNTDESTNRKKSLRNLCGLDKLDAMVVGNTP